MGTILKSAEGLFLFIGKLFKDIIAALYTEDKQLLMTDFTNLMHAEAVVIQNTTPGISIVPFLEAMAAAAVPLVIGDLVALGTADKNIVFNTIAVDLKIPETAGNAGVVTSGS